MLKFTTVSEDALIVGEINSYVEYRCALNRKNPPFTLTSSAIKSVC